MIISIRWFEVLASAFRRTYRLTLIFLLTYPHLLLYFTRPSVFLCRTYLVPYNLIAILHIPNYYSDPYYQAAYKIALFHGCFYKLPIQIYHKKTFSIIKPGYFINLIFRTGKGDSAEKQYIYIPAKLELPETADIAIKTFPWWI